MSEPTSQLSQLSHASQGVPAASGHAGPEYRTFIAVWGVLVALTALLVLVSRSGQNAAVWGLLLITPVKAALVFYFFMHLRYEGLLLKTVIGVALVTLIIFFALLFSDIAFR
jgi:cytochrome c oxidase subunit 4